MTETPGKHRGDYATCLQCGISEATHSGYEYVTQVHEFVPPMTPIWGRHRRLKV